METKLLMPFDTDDPEFTRGFECGQIWTRLEAMKDLIVTGDPFSMTLHIENAEMARRCALAQGFSVKITPLNAAWIDAEFDLAHSIADDVMETAGVY